MTHHQPLKRIALVFLAIVFAGALEVAAETHFGFSIGISNAPPPPRVVVEGPPQLVVVPGTTVSVVGNSGYDVFAYHSSFYCYSGGFWYRAARYNGPYAVVDVRSVPQPILVVPAERWKRHPHGGPPGQVKKNHGNGNKKHGHG
jgi:hypothetical protein